MVSAVSTAQELQADRPERAPRDSSGGKVKIQSDLLLPVSQKPRGEV